MRAPRRTMAGRLMGTVEHAAALPAPVPPPLIAGRDGAVGHRVAPRPAATVPAAGRARADRLLRVVKQALALSAPVPVALVAARDRAVGHRVVVGPAAVVRAPGRAH